MSTVGTLASGAMANLIHRAALGRAEGGPQARARAARDAALDDPPRELADAAPRGRDDPLRGARLLPRRRDDRRPRRLRRRPLPRPARRSRTRCRGAGGSHDARDPARSRPEGVRSMFDRIAPVYDVMNRVMTAGLDQRWRRLDRRGGRARPATACSTPAAARATSRSPRAKAGARTWSASTSPSGCSSARGARRRRSSGSRATCSRCRSRTASFDAATVGFGIRNVADLERGLARAAPRAAAGRPARDPRDHAAARAARALLPALVRRHRAAARQGPAGRLGLHVPPRERPPLPRPGRARRADGEPRLRRGRVPAASAAGSSRSTRGRAR